MRFLYPWVVLLCTSLSYCAIGQQQAPINDHPQEKPVLFAQLPDKFSIPLNSLQYIFSLVQGNDIAVTAGSLLKIEGKLITKVKADSDQISINIRCSNYKNALLNLSRINKADGSFTYTGRIVSLEAGDILMLQEEDGLYYFTRKKQLLTLVE